MSEINPYESPQSDIPEPSSGIDWSSKRRFALPTLIGLQVSAGALILLLDFLHLNTAGGFRHWHTLAEVFATIYTVVGLLLLLIAIVREKGKLIFFEFVALISLMMWASLKVH